MVKVSSIQLNKMLEKGATVGDIPGVKKDFNINDLHQPIWIPGHVPSSKNSRTNGQHNGPTATYIQSMKCCYTDNAPLFRKKIAYLNLKPPYDVYFRFIRNSEKRIWDFGNITQIVLDMMTRYNGVDDDNSNIIKPHYLDPTVDKENPGVLIMI